MMSNLYKSFIKDDILDYKKVMELGNHWDETTQQSILAFDKYCYLNGEGQNELTQELINGWCNQRPTESNNSCRSRIYPIYNFVAFLNLRKNVSFILPDIPRREASTYIPHIFTGKELKLFFSESDNIETYNMRRKIIVPVFFRLLYSSGLRICEARWLKCEDVDLKNGVLNIRKSKTSIQHYVAVHESMRELLFEYNGKISELFSGREWFFPGKKGNCLDKKWVKYNFDKLWKKVGSPVKATAYCFRHTYATENINKWIGEGFDSFDKLVYLSKSMGHASVETTMKYYQMTPAFADILLVRTESAFSELLPECEYEEE